MKIQHIKWALAISILALITACGGGGGGAPGTTPPQCGSRLSTLCLCRQ